MADGGVLFVAEQGGAAFLGSSQGLDQGDLGFGSLELIGINGPHLGGTPGAGSLPPGRGGAERAKVQIVDATLAQGSGERRLRKARPARGGDSTHVDQQVDAGRLELAEKLVERLALLADGEKRPHGFPAQSKISSSQLLRRLWGFW